MTPLFPSPVRVDPFVKLLMLTSSLIYTHVTPIRHPLSVSSGWSNLPLIPSSLSVMTRGCVNESYRLIKTKRSCRRSTLYITGGSHPHLPRTSGSEVLIHYVEDKGPRADPNPQTKKIVGSRRSPDPSLGS